MADFKLPFSAGAETSSVSFDPRRQLAPISDEATQVTRSGGKPALDVGGTIDAQFGDVEATTPGADAFADGAPGNTQQDLDNRTAQYVSKRKSVHAEYATKSAKQKKLNEQAAKTAVNKLKDRQVMDARLAKMEKSKQAQSARRHNDQVQVAAQVKRRNVGVAIDQANAKGEVLRKVKVETAKTTETKTTDTRVTDVKDTGVKDLNLAVTDPSKKPL